MALLEARSIQKVYTTRFGGNPVTALSNVSFSMEAGEYTVIMGESGSGKTTLLNILGRARPAHQRRSPSGRA